MSGSRGLALWRLARAAPRAVSFIRPKCHIVPSLPRPSQSSVYIGRRLLSSQSNTGSSDESSSLGSTPHLESDSDTDSDASDPEMTSDPDLTSDDPDDTRTAVLEAALQYVPSHGWTPAALEEGAKNLEIFEAVHDLFPRGGGELIDYFEVKCNSDLLDYMKQKVEQESVKGSKLLEDAVEQRLRMIIPYVNKWPQAMALKAFPSNAPTALENLGLMVDDIWYCAGDRSTDFNWYTKRALLATIYSSTELFLVQDTSVDFQETWQFLQRRMEDAKSFGDLSKELQSAVSDGVGLLSAGLTTTMNVLGMKR